MGFLGWRPGGSFPARRECRQSVLARSGICNTPQARAKLGSMDSASPYDALKHALAEGDLATAKQLVEALSQSPQLAAEVLHELRQPLLGIKAYAQLIAESDGSAAKKPVAVLL